DQFGRRVAGDGPVEFILYRFVEGLRDFRLWIIVDAALCVDVRNLLIKSSFTGPYLADALQQSVKVVLTKPFALLEAFVVEHEALDNVFTEGFCGPNAELSGLVTVDPVAHRDYSVKVIEVN